MATFDSAKQAKPLHIPPSSNTCEISLINTTCDILTTSAALLEPEIKGHELVESPPAVVEAIETKGIPGLRVSSGIDEILTDGGVDPESIDAVVWSHYHWDHIGNIQSFPASTDIIVGSGFRDAFLPGYPTNPASPFHEADFHGRSLHEIFFDEQKQHSLRIGKFQAHDYFGDGSFYILNTPGHTAGHLSALVRTTSQPDSFIFLGGDICHFPGMYRPSHYIPMPDSLSTETKLDTARRIQSPCSCSTTLAANHQAPGGPAAHAQQSTPFYQPSQQPTSWYEDPAEAQRSIDGLMEFDACGHVFVAIAHDPALRDVCASFPGANMNDWMAKLWKEQAHWNFLNEMPVNGEPGRPKLVEGRLKDGKPV